MQKYYGCKYACTHTPIMHAHPNNAHTPQYCRIVMTVSMHPQTPVAQQLYNIYKRVHIYIYRHSCESYIYIYRVFYMNLIYTYGVFYYVLESHIHLRSLLYINKLNGDCIITKGVRKYVGTRIYVQIYIHTTGVCTYVGI